MNYIFISPVIKRIIDFNRIKNSNHKSTLSNLIDLYSQFGKVRKYN